MEKHANPWKTWSRILHQIKGQGTRGIWSKVQAQEVYDQRQKDHMIPRVSSMNTPVEIAALIPLKKGPWCKQEA